MKNVKVPASDSYQDYLIASLKDPEEAAAYIEAILEVPDAEPELLRIALGNVAKALIYQSQSPAEAELCLEQLDEILAGQSSAAIYRLASWLNALGLKLAITSLDKTDEHSSH